MTEERDMLIESIEVVLDAMEKITIDGSLNWQEIYRKIITFSDNMTLAGINAALMQAYADMEAMQDAM